MTINHKCQENVKTAFIFDFEIETILIILSKMCKEHINQTKYLYPFTQKETREFLKIELDSFVWIIANNK